MKNCLNPALWNAAPVIDWDKFYAADPDSKVPKEYDPPQRYGVGPLMVSMPLQSPRYDPLDYYFVADDSKLTPEEVASAGKPNSAKISEDLLPQLLGPSPDSSAIPEPFRNALFWLEDNHFAEEFVSFNKWAWRPASENNDRAVALGSMKYDWTNDASKLGLGYANFQKTYLTMQESPCKKYYKLTDVKSVLGKSKHGKWLTFYVIQEGDDIRDRNGALLDVNPGDLMRLTYGEGDDPYDCAPANIVFSYLARKIAVLDEETGEVTPVSPCYEQCMTKVKTPMPKGLENTALLSMKERFDMSRATVCDSQLYFPSPDPPTGDAIEKL
jgi:hypothetical protein